VYSYELWSVLLIDISYFVSYDVFQYVIYIYIYDNFNIYSLYTFTFRCYSFVFCIKYTIIIDNYKISKSTHTYILLPIYEKIVRGRYECTKYVLEDYIPI